MVPQEWENELNQYKKTSIDRYGNTYCHHGQNPHNPVLKWRISCMGYDMKSFQCFSPKNEMDTPVMLLRLLLHDTKPFVED